MARRMLSVLLKSVSVVVLALLVVVIGATGWLVLSSPQARDAPGWSLLSEMPLPHGELASTVAQRVTDCPDGPCPQEPRLVVLGGIAGMGQVLDTVHFYDPQAQTWATGPALPEPRHHTSATSMGGSVYVTGGAASLDRPWVGEAGFWQLDPQATQWRELPDMPEPRWGHRVVAYDGRLYVVGGEGETGDVLIYDPADGWSRGAPMPEPRDHLSVVIAGDELWAIGGRAPHSLSRVDIYDPANDVWRDGPDLPEPTSGAAEGVVGDYILIFGGEEPALRGGGVFDRHWQLAWGEADAQWQPAPPPPLPVHGADGAVLDGNLVIAGGAARHGLMSLFGWTGLVQVLDADMLDADR